MASALALVADALGAMRSAGPAVEDAAAWARARDGATVDPALAARGSRKRARAGAMADSAGAGGPEADVAEVMRGLCARRASALAGGAQAVERAAALATAAIAAVVRGMYARPPAPADACLAVARYRLWLQAFAAIARARLRLQSLGRLAL